MPKTPAVDIAEELKEWTEANPLRTFRITANPLAPRRTGAKVTLAGVANLLNVSIGTVYLWETGSRQPSDENLATICRLINQNHPEKVDREWRDWMKRRPAF